MAGRHILFRQLSTIARRLGTEATASSGASTLQSQAQQQQQQLWRLGVGLAAAAAASSVTSAHCVSGATEPQTSSLTVGRRLDLSSAGISLKGSVTPAKKQRSIVFVLGGPGSGKGTQCAKLVEEFGIVHLSAGDLLRAHMKSGSAEGNMVADMIKNGQIVPSHVTNGLLEAAMDKSGKDKFLIDGFPRNEENRAAFEADTGEQPVFVLYFSCPEDVMERRLLSRNEGRTDDNIETIRKRFRVFLDSSLPVIEHYRKLGRVREIHADCTPDEVYAVVRKLFVDL